MQAPLPVGRNFLAGADLMVIGIDENDLLAHILSLLLRARP